MGFVFYALDGALFNMLGLCLLFLLFVFPVYIPTESIPPSLPGPEAAAAVALRVPSAFWGSTGPHGVGGGPHGEGGSPLVPPVGGSPNMEATCNEMETCVPDCYIYFGCLCKNTSTDAFA